MWEEKAYHSRWYLHQGLKNKALIGEGEGKAFKGERTMYTKVERCVSMPSKGAVG